MGSRSKLVRVSDWAVCMDGADSAAWPAGVASRMAIRAGRTKRFRCDVTTMYSPLAHGAHSGVKDWPFWDRAARPPRERDDGVRLHAAVIGAAAPFWRHPGDVLGRILDVTGLAVHAIGSVNAKHRGPALFSHFIDAGRAIERRRFAIFRQIVAHGHQGIGQYEVNRLVFIMRQIGKID